MAQRSSASRHGGKLARAHPEKQRRHARNATCLAAASRCILALVRDLSPADWERLSELRARFLDDSARSPAVAGADYWTSQRDLELYDCTFGTRIAWKWRAVLAELALWEIVPPLGHVVDWGCGTGIAAREYLRALGASSARRVSLWDRSSAAVAFAHERVAAEHPIVEASASPPDEPVDVLLVSHVLGELDARAAEELVSVASRARFVIWVEPGGRDVSRRLSAIRDGLLDRFDALAPCAHSASCGVLAGGQERNWCHHFARPPAEAFQSRHWAAFSRTLGVDLRSLPYAFIVLACRDAGSTARAAAPSGAGLVRARILGRPRVEKGRARIDACDASGVHERSLLAREDRELYGALDDSAGECLVFDWSVEGARIRAPRRAFGAALRGEIDQRGAAS
jgi:SAM-dependent methyltransferase